ncbi:MAG: sugar ABC transporter permease [Acidimicrobiia bacterium]|nr:sugar ABC transporter permease [Acidimicrobiia bacterium]NNF11443.1 sugar ABC transporter permease [Acidimicrobiia bacterium]NNL69941.1 sugar ABC transporter permease [Acidimicrobiia bacterium]
MADQAPPAVEQNRRTFRRWMRELGWRHLVAIAAIVFAVFPVVWIISASVNPTGSLVGQTLWPDEPTLDNFRELIDRDFVKEGSIASAGEISVPYVDWFRNTMIIAGAAAIGQTFLSALAAYAFSRMRFWGRRVGLLSVLLVQMFPQLLAFTAIFILMTDMKDVFPGIGLGTQAGLILVYLGGALGVNTWLMKGFFDTIPRDLDEAAKVDGASPNQIFFRVILPLAAPILAVIALLSFIFTINDFVIASAVLGQGDDTNFTLAIGLQRFLGDRFAQNWGAFAAGALMAGIPVIILFQMLQRFIVSGLTQGGVKG